MKLEFKLDESKTQCAYLKTLYDLIDELNLKCKTYLDEKFNRTRISPERTRIIEVWGSSTMIGWLKLRIERYKHKIENFNNKPEMMEEKNYVTRKNQFTIRNSN